MVQFSVWSMALGGVLGACVFSNVGEGLKQSSCEDKPRSFCAELNTLEPTGNACTEWRCDSVDKVCKVLSFDGDGDGAPSADCAKSTEVADCDDNDNNRSPINKSETCDGVDNDCDDAVDENSYALVGAPVARLATTAMLKDVSVLRESNGYRFLYVDGNAATFTAALRDGEATEDNAEPLGVNQAESTAVSGAILAVGTTTKSISVGALGGLQSTLFVDVDDVSALKIATDPTDAVAADYIAGFIDRQTSLADSCATIGGIAGDADIYLLHGKVGQVPGVPILIGSAVDPHPLAIAGVASNTWVVAQATATTIELYRAAKSGAPVPLQDSAITTDGVPGELAMAANEDGTQLALAYRQGCNANSAIVLALYTIEGAGETLTLRADSSTVVVPAGGLARRPEVLWRQDPSPGWLLSWESSGSKGTVAWISTAGEVVGTPILLFGGQKNLLHGVSLVHGFDDGQGTQQVGAFAQTDDGLMHVNLMCRDQ